MGRLPGLLLSQDMTARLEPPRQDFGVTVLGNQSLQRKDLLKKTFKGVGSHLTTLEMHAQKCDWKTKDHCRCW
jgi:hypothetical protein